MTPADAPVTTGLRDTLLGLLDAAERLAPPGHPVRLGAAALVVHSPRPEYLAQAVRHTSGDPRQAPWPTLTVHLVDGEHLGAGSIAAPLIPRPAQAVAPTTMFHDGGALASNGDGMLWVIDLDGGRAMRWTAGPADLPDWEALRPMRYALKIWAAHHGGALLHAGAVAGREGAAVLVGPSGTGKSTTSMACLGRGLHVLADDYCITRLDGTSATVSPTYVVGHLDTGSLDLLPHLAPRVRGIGPREKRLVPLDPLPADALELPLRTVCTIVRGGPTRLERMVRAEALRVLAPSTLLQVAGAPRETWAGLTTMLRRVEAHRLHVGALDEVAPVLAHLLGGPV